MSPSVNVDLDLMVWYVNRDSSLAWDVRLKLVIAIFNIKLVLDDWAVGVTGAD